MQGVGYGSFWDVDPAVQPSLHSNKWFGMPGGRRPERFRIRTVKVKQEVI